MVDFKYFLNSAVKSMAHPQFIDSFVIDQFWKIRFLDEKCIPIEKFNKEFHTFFKAKLDAALIDSILNDCFSYILKKNRKYIVKRALKKVIKRGYSKVFEIIVADER